MEKQKKIPQLRFPEFEVDEKHSYKKHLFRDIFLFSTGKNIKQNEASPDYNHTQKQIEKAEVWKKGLMQQMFV